MFGIGGGEIIFIMFIVLMLFGSDKVPEIAKTLGKTMAQIRNTTNDIKVEIQRGAEENGLTKQSLSNLTTTINSEISKIKENMLDESNASTEFSPLDTKIEDSSADENHVKEENIVSQKENIQGAIKRKI